jgi:hypothetical protein
MPIADYKTYCAILDRAGAARFALPAVNVTSLRGYPRTRFWEGEAPAEPWFLGGSRLGGSLALPFRIASW